MVKAAPKTWSDSLAEIATAVQSALESDPFAQAVRPNYLARWTRVYPCAAGKRLRPALVHWCCSLLGGNPENVLPMACAVEIYHNWTLVHDDIIDNDDVRRGNPTVHAGVLAEKTAEGLSVAKSTMLGQSTAILAGDILQGWAIRKICELRSKDVHSDLILSLIERIQDFLCRELISGEALDVDMSVQNPAQITENAVMDMMIGKTGALLAYSCEAGARIAQHHLNENSEEIKQLHLFANHLGVAFQLRDDWLNLFGNADVVGKSVGSDLTNRKPTLFFVRTLTRLEGSARDDFYHLSGRELSPSEVKKATQMMVECGVVEEVVELMNAHAENAIRSLQMFPDSDAKTYLTHLAQYSVARLK